jgi:hypothetical protein
MTRQTQRFSHRRRFALAVAIALPLLMALLMAAYLLRGERWSADVTERTPMEFVRYAERRLIGHPRLQSVFGPVLNAVRQRHERQAPPNLPTLGKGQQPRALAAAGYDATGRPRAITGSKPATATTPPVVALRSADALAAAMTTATPGQVFELAPGSYALARTLTTGGAGLPDQPITVRAAKPGTVEFVVTSVEAVKVTQPYWVFENLDWRGACANHDDCEHAFHVAGAARGTVVLNNRTQDFNVHFKINGENGAWPDDGLLQFNSLVNLAPRVTGAPVSLVNVNGAGGWQIVDNNIQRFAKDSGNRISYGICVKGAAQQARIERNLVVCSPDRTSRPGLRVGISMGCGGSTGEYCRDGRCESESSNGAVANNVVAHCNDFGIDLHRAREVLVAHNTLINTAGIDARHATTRALAVGNLLEGSLRDRDGARLEARDNTVSRALDTLLTGADALDLRWHESSDQTRSTPETERDFCGQRRPPLSPPGATLKPSCDAAPLPTGR